MSIGLCITPDFIPRPNEQSELHVPYYRSILYRLSDLERLAALQKPLIITVNNQCAEVGGDWHGWDETILKICQYFKMNDPSQLLYIGCGNEFDLYWKDNGSVPPEFGADIARRAARIAHNFGYKVAATSVVSERWQEYLSTLYHLCGNDVDAFDIHPYGQQPNGWHDNRKWMHGRLEDLLTTASTIINAAPLIVTEYGVKIGDAAQISRGANGEEEVAAFLKSAEQTLTDFGIDYKCWFAYCDEVGAPSERGSQAFGLVSDSDDYRPAYYAYSEVNMSSPEPPKDWSQEVGKGLLDMMKADNTTPAMASEWRPFDRKPGTPATIEQCIGLNNTTYCWNLNTGSGWRIRPS